MFVGWIISAIKRRPGRPPLELLRSYFGGGVVVPPEFFLLFFPPLWWVVFLPDFVVVLSPAGLSVLPPAAWANDRLAPSNSVNAIVSSFFIQSPSMGIKFEIQISGEKYWCATFYA